jgi:hypothetical protein
LGPSKANIPAALLPQLETWSTSHRSTESGRIELRFGPWTVLLIKLSKFSSLQSNAQGPRQCWSVLQAGQLEMGISVYLCAVGLKD